MEPLKHTRAENVGDESKEEFKEEKKKKQQLGGIRTMPFILGNDMCDRFASSGSHANLITYLTEELNLPLVKASNILSNFGGTSSFTPLVGALIADSFAGRFWTIIVGTLIYELGLVAMTISAILPQLRPQQCSGNQQDECKEASSFQLMPIYISLLLSAIGTGGIRSCVVTFAADQFDMSKSMVASRGWNFFNWYYLCMGMASLLAVTVVVYIQDNVGWGLGFGIPTIAMAFSIAIFLWGSPFYNMVKPGGSPLVRLAQVVVAAIRKRKQVVPQDPSLLYHNRELDVTISSNGMLVHSNQYRCLDRAAIITNDDTKNPNLWRLVTVHRVEELKCIVRMLPIWAAGILLVTSHSHQGTFVITQARSMNRHLSPSFEIPPASLSIFTTLTVVIGLPLYERLFVPFARRFTKNPSGVTCLQRMGIGFTINIFATIVSAFIEMKRKAVAAEYNLLDQPKATIPISVFWLLPQFCIHGIAEVFISVGHMEFLYDQSPESLRSTAMALYWMAISVGNYIGTFMVSLVHHYTGKENNWLPDRNLNRGRLENYFWLVAGIQVVNLFYYVICAWCYTYKHIEEELIGGESDEKDVELAKAVTQANGDIGGHK